MALDTAPVIYLIERHPTYLERVRPFFRAMDRGEIRVVTSSITLLEVLVLPLRRGDSSLVQQYREILLNAQGLSTLPISTVVAEEAARIRARTNLLAADAIQIATATTAGATALVTNDVRFPRGPSLQILVLDEL